MSGYVDLYSEIRSATESSSFDWSTYDSRLAKIQSDYDEGVSLLEKGDEFAASKS